MCRGRHRPPFSGLRTARGLLLEMAGSPLSTIGGMAPWPRGSGLPTFEDLGGMPCMLDLAVTPRANVTARIDEEGK